MWTVMIAKLRLCLAPDRGDGASIRANSGSSWLFPPRLDWPVVDSKISAGTGRPMDPVYM